MSEIDKYRKYLKFKANPRFLRRDFIVPLYTGTEPDIVPETGVEELETVQEFEDGGRVGFSSGTKPAFLTTKEFSKIQDFFTPITIDKMLRPSFGLRFSSYEKKQTKDIFMEGLRKSGIVTEVTGKGNERKRIFKGVNKKSMDKFNEYLQQKVNDGLLRRTSTALDKEAELIKKFVLDRKKKGLTTSFSTDIKKEFPISQYNLLKARLPKKIFEMLDTPEVAMQKVNFRRIEDQLKAAEYIRDQIANEKGFTKKKLASIMKVREKEVEGRLSNLIRNIQRANTPKDIGDKRGDFLKVFTYDERNNITQALFNSDEFKNLYGKSIKTDINLALSENSDLRKKSLKKLDDYLKVKAEIEKRFGDVIELEHPLARNIIASAGKAPGSAYLKVVPVLKQFNRYKTSLDTQRGNTYRELLQAIDEGKDTTDLVKKLTAQQKAIQTLFGEYDVGKLSTKGTIIRYGSKSLFESDLMQLLKDNLILVDNLKSNINLNKENLTTLFKEADLDVKKLELGLKLESPKVTITDVDDILNKIKNVKTKSAIDIADELSKEDVRAVCGKLNLGGLPKGCAELAKEDPEKFIKTVSETTRDTSLATKATQALNFTKGASKAAEEIIGFGGGIVGRTLGPLAALNSALEQWTAGNTAEGFRKIGDLIDLTTLIGDPLGFEKSRREGTEADIKKVIGEKNYKGFENIKAASDEYVQLLDVEKKLKRAEQATRNQFDPYDLGVDQNYVDQLKTQQSILEKNITGTKYGDVEDNLLNYADLLYQDILKRKPNSPDSSKYAFKTAVFEQLERVFKPEFINLYKEDLNKKFGPDINVLTEQQEKIKPISEEERISIEEMGAREGAAVGGRIGFSDGGPDDPTKRKFIKGAGIAGLIAAGTKFLPDFLQSLKGTKAAVKVLPKVSGMPEWFNPLVSKMIKEGIEVPLDKTVIGSLPNPDLTKVRQLEIISPDGKGKDIVTMMEFKSGQIQIESSGGAFDDTFVLSYNPPRSVIDVTGKKVDVEGSFSVIEQRPYHVGGPEDVDYDLDSFTFKKEDAISDIEKLERIATGKRIPKAKVDQRTKAREFVEKNPYDDIVNRFGDSGDYYDDLDNIDEIIK